MNQFGYTPNGYLVTAANFNSNGRHRPSAAAGAIAAVLTRVCVSR